jgi:hypothetical protein
MPHLEKPVMPHPQKPVWCEVTVHLELLEPFEPRKLERTHAGCPNLLAELLIGSPRTNRDPVELEPFTGLTSLEANVERLRVDPPLLTRLARVLDATFTALEFDIVGRRVTSVRNFDVFQVGDWRAVSPVWACLQPLKQGLW